MTRFVILVLAMLGILMLSLLLAFGMGALLPNGGQLSYTSARDGDQDIYLLDIIHGIAFNLTHTAQNEWQAVWSPDGTQIAFVSDRSGNNDIYILPVACPGWFAACPTRIQHLTTNPGSDFDPAWSPDGDHIAFVSDRFGYAEIFLADRRGGVPLRLTNNEAMDANPAWSPDGKAIVFSSNRDDSANVDLYRMDADGGHPQRIMDQPGSEFSAAFSPDGRSLAYGTFAGGSNRQLAMLDLKSGQSTWILDDQGDDDTPVFSPDGQWLAFMSYPEPGNSEIYILRRDCSEATRTACARRLTNSPYMDIYPRWRP